MEKSKKPPVRRVKDHDIFMRGLFSYTAFVLKILQYIIPPNLKPFIDFSTLKIVSDMHISDKLLPTQSDTIYEAVLNLAALPEKVRNDKDIPPFRFCFLGEFKSSKPSEPIDFQLDDYIKSIQRNDLKNNRPLSIVLPILIYHGEDTWQYKGIHDILGRYLPETILAYIPAPKYLTIDLQAMSDALIKDATDLGELRAAFLALKHAQNKQFFIDNFDELLNFAENTPTTLLLEAYVKMLLEYMQRRSGLTDKKFKEIFEQSKSKFNMPATAKKTIFDRIEDKVKKEANLKIQEANTKTLEANTKAQEANTKLQEMNRTSVMILIKNTQLADNQIVESLKLPLSFVQAIRKEITDLS